MGVVPVFFLLYSAEQLDKINICDIYKSVNIGGIYYEDICDGEDNDHYP